MEEPARMVTPFDKYFSLQFATDPTNHITLLLHSLITLSSLWLFTLLACRLYFSILVLLSINMSLFPLQGTKP